MQDKNIIFRVGLVGVLLVASSCVKYYDLIKSEFPQGVDQSGQHEISSKYCRSAVVYDQFETKALFSSLWLADDVRKAYVDEYSGKRGVEGDAKENRLKEHFEENRHWLVFYLLADVRENIYASLTEPNAFWTVYAQVDGVKIIQESIKEIEIEPEYQKFFGKSFNLFKTAYLVKFALKSEVADKISKRQFKSVELVVSSVYKKCVLKWDKEDLISDKKVKKDEDFYWG